MIEYNKIDAIFKRDEVTKKVVEDIAKYFGLDVVPILFEGPLSKGIEYVKTHPNSVIAKNGAIMEGLVARPKFELKDRSGKRLIVKIKWEDLKDLV